MLKDHQTPAAPAPSALRANFRIVRGGGDDLVLEVSTGGAVVHAKLTADDALGLALILTYEARERVALLTQRSAG